MGGQPISGRPPLLPAGSPGSGQEGDPHTETLSSTLAVYPGDSGNPLPVQAPARGTREDQSHMQENRKPAPSKLTESAHVSLAKPISHLQSGRWREMTPSSPLSVSEESESTW